MSLEQKHNVADFLRIYAKIVQFSTAGVRTLGRECSYVRLHHHRYGESPGPTGGSLFPM